MASILGSVMESVVGIVGVLLYVTFYAAINKDNMDAATKSILLVIPVILAAVIIIRAIVSGFAGGR
jgi:nucleoside permease NupC